MARQSSASANAQTVLPHVKAEANDAQVSIYATAGGSGSGVPLPPPIAGAATVSGLPSEVLVAQSDAKASGEDHIVGEGAKNAAVFSALPSDAAVAAAASTYAQNVAKYANYSKATTGATAKDSRTYSYAANKSGARPLPASALPSAGGAHKFNEDDETREWTDQSEDESDVQCTEAAPVRRTEPPSPERSRDTAEDDDNPSGSEFDPDALSDDGESDDDESEDRRPRAKVEVKRAFVASSSHERENRGECAAAHGTATASDGDDDNDGHFVAPRPGLTPGQRGRASTELTLEQLSACFHLPSERACERLGIGLTVLKRQCRKLKIGRWPYRKIQSINKLMEKIEAGESPGEMSKALLKSVEELKQHKQWLLSCEKMDLEPSIKKLQQAFSKAAHKKRKITMGAKMNGRYNKEPKRQYTYAKIPNAGEEDDDTAGAADLYEPKGVGAHRNGGGAQDDVAGGVEVRKSTRPRKKRHIDMSDEGDWEDLDQIEDEAAPKRKPGRPPKKQKYYSSGENGKSLSSLADVAALFDGGTPGASAGKGKTGVIKRSGGVGNQNEELSTSTITDKDGNDDDDADAGCTGAIGGSDRHLLESTLDDSMPLDDPVTPAEAFVPKIMVGGSGRDGANARPHGRGPFPGVPVSAYRSTSATTTPPPPPSVAVPDACPADEKPTSMLTQEPAPQATVAPDEQNQQKAKQHLAPGQITPEAVASLESLSKEELLKWVYSNVNVAAAAAPPPLAVQAPAVQQAKQEPVAD